MPNKYYDNARVHENKAVNALIENRYFAIRSAASRRDFDVLAVHLDTALVIGIQFKSNISDKEAEKLERELLKKYTNVIFPVVCYNTGHRKKYKAFPEWFTDWSWHKSAAQSNMNTEELAWNLKKKGQILIMQTHGMEDGKSWLINQLENIGYGEIEEE